LPRAANFTRTTSLASSLRAVRSFLRNPILLATYAMGGGTLFTIVGAFTYVAVIVAVQCTIGVLAILAWPARVVRRQETSG